MPAAKITFRPLESEDLTLLHQWLNKPHMRSYYQKELISLQEVVTKYLPRIQGSEPTFSYLVLLDGHAFGYIQCYRNRDWPAYASEILLDTGVSIDYFIGDEAYLKQGFGRIMVADFLDKIVFVVFENEDECFVCHDQTNRAAIKCSQAAGFEFQRNVVENNIQSCVYRKLKIYAPLSRD